MSLKLRIKKFIGAHLGYYCPECGEIMRDFGYSFFVRCENQKCVLNRKNNYAKQEF